MMTTIRNTLTDEALWACATEGSCGRVSTKKSTGCAPSPRKEGLVHLA